MNGSKRLVLAALIFGVSNGAAACRAPQARSNSHPPNIVLIVADDLGWGELGSYGQKKVRTPHLDRLAAEGMRFTQSYAGAPVCAPSRNVLLTGKHLGHVTIRGNKPAKNASNQTVEGQHPIPESALTIAELLQDAGYVTGAMGKWGLGPVGSSGDP
ncbi:MAG: sulfatase-like hydrolase/transferase, partial [Planctomycetota bacterium]